MKILKRILTVFCIFLLPFTISAAEGTLSPEEVPGAVTVDEVQAKELFDDGVIFIDVRSDKDWNAGRVPDAEHLNVKTDFTEDNVAGLVGSKDDPMVIYCNGHKCLRSSKAAKMAVDWGYTNVYYFRDGFPSWKEADNPVE